MTDITEDLNEKLHRARTHNQRLQRRLQLLEGFWARKLERAKLWERYALTDFFRKKFADLFEYKMGYKQGVNDALDRVLADHYDYPFVRKDIEVSRGILLCDFTEEQP